MKFLIFLSEAMVPLMIFYIVGSGLLPGRSVLDDFTDGAKDGMKTVAGIPPTLVGLMVSVGVFRASGFPDFLGELLKMPAVLLHIPPQVIPVVLVHLVSNSAATGLVPDISKEYGTDSSLGLIAFVLVSGTETMLYCLSVYFGSVGITRTRYTLVGGMIAMVAGVATSVVLTGAVRQSRGRCCPEHKKTLQYQGLLTIVAIEKGNPLYVRPVYDYIRVLGCTCGQLEWTLRLDDLDIH